MHATVDVGGCGIGGGCVRVAVCEFPTCHYISGNKACEKRLNRLRRRMVHRGHDPERLWNIWCSAADGPKFAKTMRDMAQQLELGS